MAPPLRNFSKNSSVLVGGSFPYLGIKELVKVGLKGLWENGWEGVKFESLSLTSGDIVGFKVVGTDVVEG